MPAQKLWCDCNRCQGGKWIGRSTYYKHAGARAESSSEAAEGQQSAHGSDGNSVQMGGNGGELGAVQDQDWRTSPPADGLDFNQDSWDDPNDRAGPLPEKSGARDEEHRNSRAPSPLHDPPPDRGPTDGRDPGSLADVEQDEPPPSPQGLVPEDVDMDPLDKDNPARPLSPTRPNDVEPTLDDLKTCLQFIRAMETASLDNGNLSERVLERIRHPPQHVLTISDRNEMLSFKQFIACHGASQQTYTAVRDNHNEYFPEAPLLSYEQVRNRVAEWSGIEAIVHDMCPNSCVAYTGPFAELERCPYENCGLSRWDDFQLEASRGKLKVPAQKFSTMPLGPQIQALWRAPETAAQLSYIREKTAEILESLHTHGKIDAYEDILQGREYLEAVQRGDIGKYTTVVMFGIDGAQLYQDKQSDCWIYIWIVIGFHPNMRYKKARVLPGGILPGPHKPKHMDSFLFPGFHHVATVQREGLRIWNAMDQTLRDANIYFLLGCSDAPGSVHISGLVGHSGALHCRLYCGMKGRHKPGIGHYYPALLKPHHYDVPECNHPDISVREIQGPSEHAYQENLAHLLGSTGDTDYERRRKVTGIVKPSLISGFGKRHRLPLTSTFAGDFMHVPTLNMGDLFLPLWRGTFTCEMPDIRASWDWAVLKGKVWEQHGLDVAACRPYLPGSFDRPPRNIALKIKSGYKSKEWQGYLYALVPALLHNILPHKYWRNFCKLALGIRLFHQRSITREQLQLGQRMIEEHLLEFEAIYIQRRTERLHFQRPCMHALIHIGLEIPRLGPPMLSSQWTMERTIGNLGEEIKQPSNPYQNLLQRALQRCQMNTLMALIPGLQKAKARIPQGAVDLGDEYVLLRPCASKATRFDGVIADLVMIYMNEARHALGVGPAPDQSVKIVQWGRVRLPTGQIARSVFKEGRTPLEKLRRARCVKFKLDDRIEFGEVSFYFQVSLEIETRAVALVRLYSAPDPILHADSCWTVYSVTQLSEEEGYRVVDVKDIQAVVAMIPHNHSGFPGDERFFVWEQMGLDISTLGVPEPDNE